MRPASIFFNIQLSNSRAERTAKYNRLLEIEDDLGKEAQYRNPFMKNNS